jgi:hypothetical protein
MKWLGKDSASDFSVRSGLKNMKSTYDIAMAVSCHIPLLMMRIKERGE